MDTPLQSGFVNFHKPAGLTSHDCVAKMRRLLHLKKVGHGGTLDPAATGVLPIAFGRATRLLPFLPEDKAYRAVIRFGLSTTTDDLEGEVLAACPVPQLTQAEAIAPQTDFIGTLEQIPPRYSAVQVQGKRLYDLARKGQTVEIPVRTVTVYSIDVVGWQGGDFPELTVEIRCGAGTYIRSIARDWGDRLQTGATLAALTRTQSGGFPVRDSLPPDLLESQLQAGVFVPIAPAIALGHLPRVTLATPEARRWQQGQKLPWPTPEAEIQAGAIGTVFDEAQGFLGISELFRDDEGQWRLTPKMVFAPLG